MTGIGLSFRTDILRRVLTVPSGRRGFSMSMTRSRDFVRLVHRSKGMSRDRSPGSNGERGISDRVLAVGIGKALYARLSGQDFHTYVFMGDGEQQKGQISESRRIAVKYKLSKSHCYY